MPGPGRRWKKGQSGNPTGKTAHPVEVKEIRRLCAGEFIEIATFLLRATDAEVDEIIDSPDAPKLQKIIARILNTTQTTGSMTSLDILLTRLFGKPKDVVEFKDKSERKPLTNEERIMLLKIARGDK